MIRLLILLILLSSCSTEKKIFNRKSDYLIRNGDRYIQATISNNKGIVNSSSENQFVIRNNEDDTICIFSTVLDNENMLYSGKNIQKNADVVVVDTYYPEYMSDAIHSGIKKFNFIQLLPNDSVTINFDVNRLARQVGDYQYDKLKMRYYYFRKRGQNFDGLVNITKTRLFEKYCYMQ